MVAASARGALLHVGSEVIWLKFSFDTLGVPLLSGLNGADRESAKLGGEKCRSATGNGIRRKWPLPQLARPDEINRSSRNRNPRRHP